MNKKLREVDFVRTSKWQYVRVFILSFPFFIKSLFAHFTYYFVNFIYGRKMAEIGKDSKVHPTVVLRQGERISIGRKCLINHNCVLQAGKKTARIIIGNNVQCGPNVMMFAFNHKTELNGIPMIDQGYWDGDILIKDNVWVGAGSIILAGVEIGEGSIIAAGSVVTKDVPKATVVAGVPATVINIRRR